MLTQKRWGLTWENPLQTCKRLLKPRLPLRFLLVYTGLQQLVVDIKKLLIDLGLELPAASVSR